MDFQSEGSIVESVVPGTILPCFIPSPSSVDRLRLPPALLCPYVPNLHSPYASLSKLSITDPCCRASTPAHFQLQLLLNFLGRIFVNRTCRQSRWNRCRIIGLYSAYHGKSTLIQNMFMSRNRDMYKKTKWCRIGFWSFFIFGMLGFFLVRFVSPSNIVLWLCSAYQGKSTLI